MSYTVLKLQVVVISGSSAGIGLACAEVFAESGCHLVLGARRVARLEEKTPSLIARGAASVTNLCLDVCSSENVQAFAAAALQRHAGADVLINNAGLAKGTDPVATGKDADWETMIETNFTGALRLVRAFLPSMLSRGKGHIINMGSVAGQQIYAGGAVYCGTKHALRAVSQTLRLELNGTPLRVSSIDPGMVETEFSHVRFGGDEKRAKEIYKGMIPLTGHDIAETAAFIASRPPHVTIEQTTIMPTDQASVYKVYRRTP